MTGQYSKKTFNSITKYINSGATGSRAPNICEIAEKIGDDWLKLVSASVPQHIYIFGFVSSSRSIISHNIGEIGEQMGDIW